MAMADFPTDIRLEGVKGVGTIHLDFEPNQRVYCLLGENGVGKTKLLEALFQAIFVSSDFFPQNRVHQNMNFLLSSLKTNSCGYRFEEARYKSSISMLDFGHFVALHFIGAQQRGAISQSAGKFLPIGSFSKRKEDHLSYILSSISSNKFSELGSSVDISTWFISIAAAASPYQSKKDNRQVEIETTLKLLHAIDSRVDPEFLEISGDPFVYLKIDGEKRELSQLSSGFTSILKIIQSIVSGYGYFTNEVQLQHVSGLVLIDEIESHLHSQWLVKIVPLLKKLFPNTIFIITTHSPIVLTQLRHGEAYKLKRDADGVVRTQLIEHPSNAALIDLLQDGFDLNLNQVKMDNTAPDDQKILREKLLEWLDKA